MQAIEWAKEQEIRLDRWFFQDGKYSEITSPDVAPSCEPWHFSRGDRSEKKP
jgi:hypothetical protein